MAKHQWLTPRQKGIVRRYYENKDDVAHQAVSEIVSELYLCTDAKKAERLWKKAETALVNTGVHKTKAHNAVADRDLEKLAKVVSEVF